MTWSLDSGHAQNTNPGSAGVFLWANEMTQESRLAIVIDASKAKIDVDRLNAALRDLEAQGVKVVGVSDETSKGLAGVGDSARGASGSIAEMATALGSVVSVAKLWGQIESATFAAGRYEQLGVIMNTLGRNAGYSAYELAQLQGQLEKTGISMAQSRQVINQMIQAQMDLSQATQLARLAQDAATIANTSSSEALARLIRGIQTAQTETLRTMGITVNFESAYKSFADELGRTTASLTEQEKTQARVNAVMEQGETIAGAYEASMETANKQMGSMERHAENLSIRLGEAYQPAFKLAIEGQTAALKLASENAGGLSAALAGVTAAAAVATTGVLALRGGVVALNVALNAMRAHPVVMFLSALAGVAAAAYVAMGNTSRSAADVARTLDEMQNPLNEVVAKFKELSQDAQAAKLVEYTEAQVKAVEELDAAYGELLGSVASINVLRFDITRDELGEVADRLRAAREEGESLSPILQEVAQKFGIPQSVLNTWITLAGNIDEANGKLANADQLIAAVEQALGRLSRSARDAGASMSEGLGDVVVGFLEDVQKQILALEAGNSGLARANQLIFQNAGMTDVQKEAVLAAGRALDLYRGMTNKASRSTSGFSDALATLNLSDITNALERETAQIELALSGLEIAWDRGDMGADRYFRNRIALAQSAAQAQENAIKREIAALNTLTTRGRSGQQVRERLADAETRLAVARARNTAELAQLRAEEEAHFRGPSMENIRSLEEAEKALREQNRALQEQIEFFGLAGSEVEKLRVARLDEALAQQYAALATAQANDVAEDEIARINDLIAALYNLRNARDASAGLQARHEAMQAERERVAAVVQSWSQGLDRVNDLFIEGFSASLDRNENAFDAFADNAAKTLKNALAAAIYEATLKPAVVRFVAQMAGMVGGPGVQQGLLQQSGLSSGPTGIPGGGNLLSSAGNYLSGLSVGAGASTAAGGSLAFANAIGAAGGDALGALIGANSAWTSAAGSITGALGSVASALGTAMPYIGIGVAAYSLLQDAFKGETRYGGSFLQREGQFVGRTGGPSGGADTAATAFAQNLLATTSDALERAFSSAGVEAQLANWLVAFEDSEKGRGGTYSFGDLIVDGEVIRFGTRSKGEGHGGTSGSIAEMMGHAEVDAWQTVIQGLQSVTDRFPRMLQDLIRGVDADSLGLEAAHDLVQTFVAVAEQTRALAEALGVLPFAPAIAATFDFAAALAEAAGGAENAANLLGSFYQNYYSEAERAAWLTDRLTRELAELGIEFPKTREEFRGLVEANMALGEAGARTVAVLLGMEAALSTLLPAFENVADAADEAAREMNAAFDEQMTRVRELAAEASRLLGLRSAAGSLLDRINRSTNFAGQREQELWAALQTASYEQQIELASELTDIVLQRYETEAQAVERIRGAIDNVARYAETLRIGELSPLTIAEQLAEAGRQYSELMARAQSGDVDAINELQRAADAYLRVAREAYASSDEYTRIFNYVAGSLDGLTTQAQSEAERQLGLSQETLAELGRLSEIAETAYGAIDSQYQATLLGLTNETHMLAELGTQTGRLNELGDILRGLPAEIAAHMQPVFSGAINNMVSGLYVGTGITPDQSAMDYWGGQLATQPAAQVTGDFYKTLVDNWYKDTLGWEGDIQGIEYWAKQARHQGPEQAYEDFLVAAGINSHRDGLRYVPRDEYPAMLHKAEAVLTAREAREWRNNEGPSNAEIKALLEKVLRAIEAADRNNVIGLSTNTDAINRTGERSAEAAEFSARQAREERYALPR